VLNAKQHEKEAGIIASAGEPGAVTVATNMAGRGVDIVLGGKEPQNGDNQEWQQRHNRVLEMGGLYVIGTERHEARRIDNQLRGRAGRQGDPGSSRFYVSLTDDIMRRFGGERVKSIMDWAGMDENTAIENKMISRSIENAQTRVEGYYFDARKHLVEYDDVINKQREVIYEERRKIIGGVDLKSNILSMVAEEIKSMVAVHLTDEHEPDINGLLDAVATIFSLPMELNASALGRLEPEQVEDKLVETAQALYKQREQELGSESMRMLERLVMLRVIDNLWVEHLTAMEYMRQGIGLQAMAQRDPLVAYKRQSHEMFQHLLSAIQYDVAHTIFRVGIRKGTGPAVAPAPVSTDVGGGKKTLIKAVGKKVGRNDPCPCGSGKKYKKCCGR
jgi:preprotein translocase subunit SecA